MTPAPGNGQLPNLAQEPGRPRYRRREQAGRKNNRRDTCVFHIFLPNVETKA
jgi:hypothetical protein